MGFAALNPFSRLRGAIRVLLANAARDAALDAVGQLAPTLRGLDGPVIDAVRESEDRIMSEISDLRARLNFGANSAGLPMPDGRRPSLEPTDTMNPRRVMSGPSLAQGGQYRGLDPERHDGSEVPPGPYEAKHCYAPDRRRS